MEFDRQRYLDLARREGAQLALTQLHLDLERWEHDTFEGPAGWKPDQFERLKLVRDFSREIWEGSIVGKLPTS